MARLKVFISSTFYDLKHVRYDLESFIRSLGYDPIMNDRGNIPYSKEKTLQDSCYDEVNNCDILVGIIGNKYGTNSNDSEYSISMKEIRTAIKKNKQVFIFVDKSVLFENRMYIENKENKIKYVAVDDIKIHAFIEELQSLSINNAIFAFESAIDITNILKEQLAGLFQGLLQEKATVTEQTTYYDLKEITNELRESIKLSNEHQKEMFFKFDSAIFAVNYAVTVLFKKLGFEKPIILASNREMLFKILKSMCFYGEEQLDVFDSEYVFKKTTTQKIITLKINEKVFDKEGKIHDIRDNKKLDEYIVLEEEKAADEDTYSTADIKDDDLPF